LLDKKLAVYMILLVFRLAALVAVYHRFLVIVLLLAVFRLLDWCKFEVDDMIPLQLQLNPVLTVMTVVCLECSFCLIKPLCGLIVCVEYYIL
jgi:hypothetical protein